MSNRSEILAALVGRLEGIQTTAGFATNAGSTVFTGFVPLLGGDDPDTAIALVAGDDNPRHQGLQVAIDLPIHVYAVAKADLDDPGGTVETLLADIKTAIETDDTTVGRSGKATITRGPTRAVPRETGQSNVGVSITWVVTYSEVWGNP